MHYKLIHLDRSYSLLYAHLYFDRCVWCCLTLWNHGLGVEKLLYFQFLFFFLFSTSVTHIFSFCIRIFYVHLFFICKEIKNNFPQSKRTNSSIIITYQLLGKIKVTFDGPLPVFTFSRKSTITTIFCFCFSAYLNLQDSLSANKNL